MATDPNPTNPINLSIQGAKPTANTATATLASAQSFPATPRGAIPTTATPITPARRKF